METGAGGHVCCGLATLPRTTWGAQEGWKRLVWNIHGCLALFGWDGCVCVCDSPWTSGILLPHFQAGRYKYFSGIAEPCQLAFASGRVSAGKGGRKAGKRRCARKMRHLPGNWAPAPRPDSRGAPPPLGMLFPLGEVHGRDSAPPGPDGRTHPISNSRGLLPGWTRG